MSPGEHISFVTLSINLTRVTIDKIHEYMNAYVHTRALLSLND
jgi:hypothetical protein